MAVHTAAQSDTLAFFDLPNRATMDGTNSHAPLPVSPPMLPAWASWYPSGAAGMVYTTVVAVVVVPVIVDVDAFGVVVV